MDTQDTNALVSAIRTAVSAENKLNKAKLTALDASGKVADILLGFIDTGLPTVEEAKRVVKMAQVLIVEHKIKMSRTSNIISHVHNQLLTRMVPNLPVQIAPGKGDSGPVVKPAEQCKTAKEVRAAAKAIREIGNDEMGKVDNRSKNAPPIKASTVKAAVAKFVELLDVEEKATRAELAKLGFTVTLRRTTIKAVPSKKVVNS